MHDRIAYGIEAYQEGEMPRTLVNRGVRQCSSLLIVPGDTEDHRYLGT